MQALKGVPEEQRGSAVSRIAPIADGLGVDMTEFTVPGNLTDASLDEGLKITGQFIQSGGDRRVFAPVAMEGGGLGLPFEQGGQAGVIPLKGTVRETPEQERIADLEAALKKAKAQADIKVGTEEGLVDVAADKALKTSLAKASAEEINTQMSAATDAIAGAPQIKRAIELLKTVKTGGIQSAALGAKQFFGVDTAEEGELNSLLGEAVLGDLKRTFGAAFTKEEVNKLTRIRANFGRSSEANIRLLEQALDITEASINRGLKAAVKAGDSDKAKEFIDGLNALKELPPATQPTQIGRFQIEVVE
jgi:hypothetical protein